MKVQFKLALGGTEFTIEENCENQAEFVEKVAFFSGLPKTGPNGEDDLEFSFRTTTQGYKYYSLVSKKANKEYKLGQSQKKPGELFNRDGWTEIYQGDDAVPTGAVNNGLGQTQQAQVQNQAVNNGLGMAQQPVPQQQFQQPIQQQVAQPVQQATPQPQQVQQPIQQQAAPVQQQVAQPIAQQNQQVANDVLAQFGITN